MKRRIYWIGLCLVFSMILAPTAECEEPLRVANVFNESMVLPSARVIPIWGWGPALASLHVSLGTQTATTTSDKSGFWAVSFPPQQASFAPRSLLVQCGEDRVELDGLLVGRVWLAAGQSNMQWTLGQSLAERAELADRISLEESMQIRFVHLDLGPATEIQNDLPKRVCWTRVDRAAAANMSGVAFFFAQRLAHELQVPIGIIDVSRGGTPIEPFIPRDAFLGHPTLEAELQLGDIEDLAGLKALRGGVFARDVAWLPGRLFHSRIAPLVRLPIHGAIWYQGESNCGIDEDPTDYRVKMHALRRGWRTAFGQADLPIHYVQLPGSGAGANWPMLREEQRVSQDLPTSGMVVTIDLEGDGIHPWNKFDVGDRLARLALYDEPNVKARVPRSGPTYTSMVRLDDSILIQFDGCSDLWIGCKSGTDAPMRLGTDEVPGFEVRLGSGEWKAVEAKVGKASVRLTGDGVLEAKAIRYAWSPTPPGTFVYDDSLLPASPMEIKLQ
ncbi:MAG: hypothetical protein JNL67_16550 [Planctomycetaceae bacterium]|nr:hypothetical protein [Planctomycetaceae bacterium]